MKLPKLFVLKVLFVATVLCNVSACNNTSEIPFPFSGTEFPQPVSRPFKFSEPKKIDWELPHPDSIKPPVVSKFDFSNIPSRPFDNKDFKQLKTPPEEIKFDWGKLPDSAFNLEQLPEMPFTVKTYILDKPILIKAGLPSIKDGDTSGMLVFGRAQGLPGKDVTDLLQDKNGMIWIIVSNILCRYNGEYLEQYLLPGKPFISNLMEDQDGRFWIGGYAGSGLFVVDIKNMLAQRINGITENNLFPMHQDEKGLIWIGSTFEGIYILDQSKKMVKNFRRFKDKPWTNSVFDGARDDKGNTWLAGSSGVWVIEHANKKVKFIDKQQGLIKDPSLKIEKDSKDRMWISTFDIKSRNAGGIYIVSADEGTILRVGKTQGVPRAGWSMKEDNEHNYWLTADSAIYVLDKKLGEVKKIITNNKFFNQGVAAMIKDANGQMWVGSFSGEINLINPTGLIPVHMNTSNGLSGNKIWGLMEDSRSNIWIGGSMDNFRKSGWINLIDSARENIYDYTKITNTDFYSTAAFLEDRAGRIYNAIYGVGIKILDQKNNSITQIGNMQGLKSSRITSLIKDTKGMLWAGTENEGLYTFDVSANVIKHLGIKEGLSENHVYCLIEDKEGKIWAGTQGGGVEVIDPKTGTLTHLNEAQGLSDKNVACMTEDSRGRIWIATDKGISIVDANQENITIVSVAEGIADNAVYALAERDGQMYIGTANGLTIVTPPGKKNENVGLEDQINRWDFRSFGKFQGFPFLDYNSNSVLLTRKNQLWFGIDFSVLTKIDDFKEDSVLPGIVITGLTILDKPQFFSGKSIIAANTETIDTLWDESNDIFYVKGLVPTDTGYLQKNKITWDNVEEAYNLPVNLKLPYHQNYLGFQFASTQYSNRDKIRYRYILEGIDKNWSPVSEKPFSENYRDLPPGKYIFKVCSKGINGLWSQPAAFSFTILPPWRQTWWAYVLYVLIFASILRFYIRYRSRILKQENVRLEEKIQERTIELKQSLEELKSAQAQLIQSEKMASLGELTAGIAHEIQNPLNFVNNFSDLNKEMLVEMKDEMNKGNLEDAKAIANDVIDNEEKINLHGKRAESIVKGMLEHSRKSTGVKEPTDINKLCDEFVRLSYHGLRAKDSKFNCDYKLDLDPHLPLVNVVSQDIGRVILNIVNNAFQACAEKQQKIFNNISVLPPTPKGEQTLVYQPLVSIKTNYVASLRHCEICISDNGPGIPDSIKDKIFQPFFSTKPTGQGTGLGLSLSYDIVKAHGGELKVETKEARPDDTGGRGEGSEFIIKLPVA